MKYTYTLNTDSTNAKTSTIAKTNRKTNIKKTIATYTAAAMSVVLSITSPATADENTAFIVDLPLYDSPYNTSFSAKNPSMTQALQVSKAFYQFSHYQINSLFKKNTDASLISIIVFDSLATWLPLSNGWLHEEWHRSVMGQYGINSRNDIYDLEFFKETISVSHVNDSDLIWLKTNHPADLIRLHTAGLESQNQLNLSLEYDQFFENTQMLDSLLLWFNNINTSAYLNACSTTESNEITSEILKSEGRTISQRDFTGLDCNAWVYDLFRPDELYVDRGTHPSGNGINRYISHGDLTEAEKTFLRKQYYLSFLNFVDPFLLNKRYFKFTAPANKQNSKQTTILWNANIKHYLTPFGYTINLHGYIKTAQQNYLITLNNHFNKNHYFPGISAGIINLPFTFGDTSFNSTVKARLWQQPEQFSFTSSSSSIGGSLSAQVEYRWTQKFGTYFQFFYKTPGWLEGNVYLNSNTAIILGLRIRA